MYPTDMQSFFEIFESPIGSGAFEDIDEISRLSLLENLPQLLDRYAFPGGETSKKRRVGAKEN